MASPLLAVPGGDYNRNGQDVQMFINDQHGQIIIITVVVELKTAGLGPGNREKKREN